MEVSIRAKQRFCKDCNIPIKLFQEPYFTDRLNLYDIFFETLKKWDIFLFELGKYHCEQDYFEEYNRVKDAVILYIKNTEGYQKFNEEDMSKYSITNKNLPNKDMFKDSNDGRYFISIDMRKANFSSLYHYDNNIFGGARTWEEFVGKFTDNIHIINSKYIRQVILGNCNPRRQVTYEKYVMDAVLIYLTKVFISIGRVVFFSNDEIVFDICDMSEYRREEFANEIRRGVKDVFEALRIELFSLHKIGGTDGYYKEIIKRNKNKKIEFKCLDNYILPFVIRQFIGEEVRECDRVFYHEGLLSKFIEDPKIEINMTG